MAVPKSIPLVSLAIRPPEVAETGRGGGHIVLLSSGRQFVTGATLARNYLPPCLSVSALMAVPRSVCLSHRMTHQRAAPTRPAYVSAPLFDCSTPASTHAAVSWSRFYRRRRFVDDRRPARHVIRTGFREPRLDGARGRHCRLVPGAL